jgi:FlaA1/EpsC-like NDP-sugar epimerase
VQEAQQPAKVQLPMTTRIEAVLPQILGRDVSFLQGELEESKDGIRGMLSRSRVLVIGAAGSIGSAFVRELTAFRLGALHLIDISENSLAEVVRNLRSSGTGLPGDFCTYAIDFTGPEMDALLGVESYDFVFNFSALKHVRSERDPFTLMRLLEVNILGNAHLLDVLAAGAKPEQVFSVSSDKAVRPANLMGASKAFMERLFLLRADEVPFGSARFANVAFSDGSLLCSFLRRLESRQPISAPSDVRRYFISHEEAGQLCLLGAFTGNNREIYFPKFRPESDMMTFAEIARLLLRCHGLEPLECQSEQEALERAAELTAESRLWPCYFTGSDTTGEKEFEEFFHPDEETDLDRFPHLGVVTGPLCGEPDKIGASIETIKALRRQRRWTKSELVDAVQSAVSELEHVELGRDLDQKM